MGAFFVRAAGLSGKVSRLLEIYSSVVGSRKKSGGSVRAGVMRLLLF